MTERRKTITVRVGGVPVGSQHPIVVQSMTNTDTADVQATVLQISELFEAGSEMVRITVNNDEAAQAVPEIIDRLEQNGIQVPIIVNAPVTNNTVSGGEGATSFITPQTSSHDTIWEKTIYK